MARSIGAAPRQRGSSERVDIDAAETRRVEHRSRQDQPIGRDDGNVELERRECRDLVGAQPLRRPDRDTFFLRQRRDRRRLGLMSAPARPRRLRIDGGDVVAGVDQRGEARHGEIGGAHEGNS